MKTTAWILGIISIAMLGYIVYSLAAARSRQPDYYAAEVSAESIRVYETRAQELELRADSLRRRLTELRLIEQPGVQLRLAALQRHIDGMRKAVDEWRSARTGAGGPAAFRQCVLLYGKAAGVCDALAPDTLK